MTHKIKSKTTYTGYVLCSISEFEALESSDTYGMGAWYVPVDFATGSEAFDVREDLCETVARLEQALTELRAKILKDFENDQ